MLVLEADLNAAELTVVRRMGAVEGEDVVAGLGGGRLPDSERQVVVVHERLAAGVFRERVERVLRPLQPRDLLLRERAGEHPDAARRPLVGVAERRHRDQSTRVHREDLDVRADRGIGGRAHLRVVVSAVHTEAVREEDERLLLGQRTQHRHRRLQRRQLPVGGEDVELAVVLAECGAEVLEVEHAVAVGVLAVGQDVEDVRELPPVVGEILLHPHGPAAIRQDRDEIRLGHLAVQVGRRAGEHALLGCVVGIREVEEQDDQAPVAEPCVAGRRHRDTRIDNRRHLRGC